jgi:hypothetical protein
MTNQLKIVAAAIRMQGINFTGPHHATIISDMVRTGFVSRVGDGSEQGFLASDNQFYGREEARKIAEAAGQIKFPLSYGPSDLYSEELWHVPNHWLK